NATRLAWTIPPGSRRCANGNASGRLSGTAIAGSRRDSRATSEAAAMIKAKSLLYVAPIALVGFLATDTSAAPAAWSGSLGRSIPGAMPEGNEAPLVLVRRGGRGGGGGGFRGGGGGARAGGGFGGARGGGGSWAGAGRGNFSGGNRANIAGGNRANISGGNRTNISGGNRSFNQANVNRNVNVSGGGGYYGGGGYGWGGVAGGVCAGAVVGAP